MTTDIPSAARRVADVIEINRDRASGKPVIRGTRFTVAQMLTELADGPGPVALAQQFPTLDADAIKAALEQLADSPVLDAVGDRADRSRSEHWRGAMWAAINAQDPFYASVLNIGRIADTAIALAEVERAAEHDAAYEWVRGIHEATGNATPALRETYEAYKAWEAESAGASDANHVRAELDAGAPESGEGFKP